MRELVLGAMPKNATPSSHIASGAWCFSLQEKDFPLWDGFCLEGKIDQKNYFPLPPDPFLYDISSTEKESIDVVAQSSNYEVHKWIQLFQKEYNSFFSVEYSEKFWTMALGPWLLLAIHMLAERQKRMMDLVTLYGHEQLIVWLLPKECSFSFTSSHDFMIHGVQDRDFNHYLFSRIIESIAPKNWKIAYLSSKDLTPGRRDYKKHKNTAFTSLAKKVRRFFQERLRLLPFPRQKNIGVLKSLLFSVALGINSNPKDNTIPFIKYTGTPMTWVFEIEPLIRKMIPYSISGLQYLPAIPKARGKLRGMTAVISQDDTYRFILAAWLEGGGKLFSIQHGANYGNLRVMGGSIFEYMQHAFITWGWRHHKGYPVNAVSLPMQSELCEKKRKKAFFLLPREKASLILVGTEMSPYSYRLKSRPLAKAQVEYRQSKISFLHNLSDPLFQKTQYRPYFPVRYGLDDTPYITQYFPNITICKGDLTEHLLTCGLLVLDHYGTTLFSALSANIPTICFWNPLHWGMDTESAKAIGMLKNVGVWYPTAEHAANFASKNWENIEEWWHQETVQKVRKDVMHLYANQQTGVAPVITWFKTLASL